MAVFIKLGDKALYNVECIEAILLVNSAIEIRMKDGKTFLESWQGDEGVKIARETFKRLQQGIEGWRQQ